MSLDPMPQQESRGQEITTIKSRNSKADDVIEGGGGADVDEGKESSEDADGENGDCGHASAVRDAAEDVAEGGAPVAGEGPGHTACSRDYAGGAGPRQEKDDGNHGGSAGGRGDTVCWKLVKVANGMGSYRKG